MSSTDFETIAIVSDLIRGLRHELGNLTTVLTYDVAQIEDYFTSEDIAPNGLNDLKADLHGLREILIRLKQYPQPSVSFQPFDLTMLLTNVVADADCAAQPMHIQVQGELPSKELWINGDDDGLYAVFLNIVINAIEANRTSGGQRIEVRLKETPGEAAVTVTDQGPGFTAEMLQNAFRPSYTTRITDGFMRGLGLGLFSARAILRLHGGSIQLGNGGHGHGAVVTVRLPR